MTEIPISNAIPFDKGFILDMTNRIIPGNCTLQIISDSGTIFNSKKSIIDSWEISIPNGNICFTLENTPISCEIPICDREILQ